MKRSTLTLCALFCCSTACSSPESPSPASMDAQDLGALRMKDAGPRVAQDVGLDSGAQHDMDEGLSDQGLRDVGSDASSDQGEEPRRDRQLTSQTLNSASSMPELPVSMAEFGPIGQVVASTGRFEGTLTLAPVRSQWQVIRDDYGYTKDESWRTPPALVVSLTTAQDGTLIPSDRRLRTLQEGAWWAFVGAGRTWQEQEDRGWHRASLPVTWVQPYANCSLHGALTWMWNEEGNVTPAYYQVLQETCLYLKMNMWGGYDARFDGIPLIDRAAIAASHAEHVAARLPTKPLEELGTKLEIAKLGGSFTPEHVTLRGVVADGVHYHSGCPTRQGKHPWCEELALPSYSTAKTGVAALAYLALAARDGRTTVDALRVKEAMPQAPESWHEVTLAHLLDMTSGHYRLPGYLQSEGSAAMSAFFLATEDGAKTDAALAFPKAEPPGQSWVYQTSQTFLAGRVMQHHVGQDLHQWLVQTVYKPLALGQPPQSSLKTWAKPPAQAHPYAGYGTWWHPSDLVKLSQWMMNHKESSHRVLDQGLIDEVLQRTESGVATGVEGLRYHRGFWSTRFGPAQGFACTFDVPFMSGFGGITVAWMPNGTLFYIFSDNDEFVWADAVTELYKLQPWCT